MTSETETKVPVAATGKPKFLLVEKNLHYQKDAGGEMVFNVDIPFGILRKATANDADEQDQFLTVLEMMGGDNLIGQLDLMGSIEVMALIARFFEEYEALSEARVGESKRSSNS